MHRLYAAFDLYPSAKGAATHIHQMAKALFDFEGEGTLLALGNPRLPKYQQEDNWEIYRFDEAIPNFLERTEAYGLFVHQHIRTLGNRLELCHYRDIWSALPILHPRRSYKTVFEVNSLPSIELPYRYPSLSPRTLRKIEHREQFALLHSDRIIVPSAVIRQKLQALGVPSEKIRLISNGANIPAPQPKPQDAPEKYLIYFGALQPWQGVDILLRAFAQLQDYPSLKLLICCSTRPKAAKRYQKLARKLGLEESVVWRFQLDKPSLYAYVQHALLSVAPLKEDRRNLEQGCNPLKIYESMACGTPVVASELPVVREVVAHNQHGRLLQAERPATLARNIRILLDMPEKAQAFGQQALAYIQENHLWSKKSAELKALYQELLNL